MWKTRTPLEIAAAVYRRAIRVNVLYSCMNDSSHNDWRTRPISNGAETHRSGSLRIAAAFSVAILLVVVGTKMNPQETETPLVAQRAPAYYLSPRAYIEETDIDKDGLPDWKEVLKGTDPANPDSDDDGVLDAEETASPRTAVDDGTDDVFTDRIISRIVEEYLSLKDRGAYTPERGRAAGQLIADEARIETPFTPYSERELTTVAVSVESASAHRSGLQVALEPLRSFREPELLIYGRYIETHDPANLEVLAKRADAYRTASRDLLDVPVPADLKDTHLAAANALSFFASVLDNMIVQVHDPLASVTILAVFTRSEDYLQSTIGKINDYHYDRLATSS